MAVKTRRYVKEIAATHSPYVIDLVTGAIRWLVKKAYTDLDYDEDELAALYEMSQSHPLVFLPRTSRISTIWFCSTCSTKTAYRPTTPRAGST